MRGWQKRNGEEEEMLTTSFFRSQITISASMMQFLTFALNRDETRSA